MKDLICIMCPKGCHLKVDEEHGYTVTGNRCPRGAEYGHNELKNPTRVITSTVRLRSKSACRLPVKTDGQIPKYMMEEPCGFWIKWRSRRGACRRCGGRQYLPHRGALCGHQNSRRISVFPWPACSGKRAVLMDRRRRVPYKFPKLKTLSFFGKIGTEAGVPLVAAGG